MKKMLLVLMFASLNAVASDAFQECFDLGLTANINDPARVCFNSKEQAGKINTYEVEIFSRTNSLLSKQKVKMASSAKPGVPFKIVNIKSEDGLYQVSAQRLNNFLSFSFLRDSSGEVFHEYHSRPNPGRPSNGCIGRRCR